MGNFFENLPACIWFEGGDKRNAIASLVAGTLFFMGWWLIIDANVTHSEAFSGAYHVCGIVSSISFIMINIVSTSQTQNDMYSGGCLGPRGTRLWLFVAFVCGFAAVIASCWILFYNFTGQANDSNWVGAALLLQNAFIFGSSLVYKFGRVEDPWG